LSKNILNKCIDKQSIQCYNTSGKGIEKMTKDEIRQAEKLLAEAHNRLMDTALVDSTGWYQPKSKLVEHAFYEKLERFSGMKEIIVALGFDWSMDAWGRFTITRKGAK
jgi:hypothetical protein